MSDFRLTSGAVVLNEQNEILLKKDPIRGWELPGGMVEQGESIDDAVIREVKEETGLDIELVQFCGVSQEMNKNICNFWWIGKPVKGELTTSSESLEIGFFKREDALKLITNVSFKEELLKILDNASHPFFLNV